MWPSIQTAPVETGWLDLADRYGLPLIALVAMFVGFRWLYLRALADVEHERARAEALENTIRSDAIPALVRATEALLSTSHVLERVERKLDQG